MSARPHPWAYLRDRLCPDLISVAWAGPDATDARPAPWAVAGTGPSWPAGLDVLRGRLALCHWVGPAPAGLPVAASEHDDWRSVAASLQRALAVEVAGVRLAPGCGLALPGGTYVPSAPELETLLAAYPEGLAGTAAARRRVAAQLRRLRQPLRVARHGGRIRLERTDDGVAT